MLNTVTAESMDQNVLLIWFILKKELKQEISQV